MNGADLLQRRAERGTPRGSDIVWAAAQSSQSPDQKFRNRGPGSSAVLFRVAIVAWTVGLGAIVYEKVNGDLPLATARSETESAAAESTEPLPEPLLIDGMTLERVSRPHDPDFDGDDLLDDLGLTRGEVTHFGEQSPERSVVFADPEDPYNNPIVGLNLLEGGGFRPWSANTGDTPLTDFTSQLVQVDGEWTMPEESGLVEVARLEAGSSYDNLMFGWQFDFGNGNDNVILQAETIPLAIEQTVWVWVARLSQGADQPPTIGEIDVLSHQGVLIDLGRADEPSDEVVWAADDFVYRLTADTVQDNTAVSRSAAPETTRLQLVDRADWVEAVKQAESATPMETIGLVLSALGTISLIGSAIVFGVRRSWKPLAIALLTLGVVVALGGASISTVPV